MKNRGKTMLQVYTEQYHKNGILYDFGKGMMGVQNP
jgi:hypothetical protein